MKLSGAILTVSGIAALAGCGNSDAVHLVFGQQQTVGLEISASAPEQGGGLSLGYRDRNIAVVPVAVKEGSQYKAVGGTNNGGGDGDENDAYSTIGQFELQAEANGTTASVGLGKFFATGLAAQRLADGFREDLSNQTNNE